MKHVFDSTGKFYQNHYQKLPFDPEKEKESAEQDQQKDQKPAIAQGDNDTTEPEPEAVDEFQQTGVATYGPSWTRNLRVGDMIDAIKQDPQFEISAWSKAEILEMDSVNNEIHVRYHRDIFTPPKTFDLSSSEIDQYCARTDVLDSWKDSLDEMSICDCLDGTGVWYRSTVVERSKPKNETSAVMVKVGFREYGDFGENTDKKGRKYSGYSEKIDKVISVNSCKLAPIGTYTKIGQTVTSNRR